MRRAIFILCIGAAATATLGATAGAADDARRAQVAAAASDALLTLERDVLAAPITPELSVDQFIRKTDSRELFAKALRRAEQIGGTRWLDDQTCQVKMELPGSELADVLVRIARAKPDQAGMPAGVIERRVDRLKELTFAATGMSTSAIDRLRPPPEQAAWRGVPDEVLRAAVSDARRSAASQVLASVQDIQLAGPELRLGKVLADQKVHDDIQGWLMNRPVTSVDFKDDLEVRVAVAVQGDSFWNELTAAVGDRKELAFPTDEVNRSRVKRLVLQQVEPTVGRAMAKVAGAATQRVAVDLPRDPPRWVAEQVDARGSARAVDSRLKTARAAETEGRDRLRGRLEALPLSRQQTLGEAARQDDRVRTAIDRAVGRVRPHKVRYLSDGSAEVSFSLDLRDLWYELDTR